MCQPLCRAPIKAASFFRPSWRIRQLEIGWMYLYEIWCRGVFWKIVRPCEVQVKLKGSKRPFTCFCVFAYGNVWVGNSKPGIHGPYGEFKFWQVHRSCYCLLLFTDLPYLKYRPFGYDSVCRPVFVRLAVSKIISDRTKHYERGCTSVHCAWYVVCTANILPFPESTLPWQGLVMT